MLHQQILIHLIHPHTPYLPHLPNIIILTWRINHTGVRSVTSPRAERISISRSPDSPPEAELLVVEVDGSSVTVDWRRVAGRWDEDAEDEVNAATAAVERRVATIVSLPIIIVAKEIYRCLSIRRFVL